MGGEGGMSIEWGIRADWRSDRWVEPWGTDESGARARLKEINSGARPGWSLVQRSSEGEEWRVADVDGTEGGDR